ncbi:MAG: radical SAM protein [Candidatus Nitrotoga sp.]
MALPLLAGGIKSLGMSCSVWDLTQEYARRYTAPPSRDAIVDACRQSDFAKLDNLYFDWEDQFVALTDNVAEKNMSGLLSGFSFSQLRSLPLEEAATLFRNTSPYSYFYRDHALPRLAAEKPAMVGITVSSLEQLLPATELLTLIREQLPETFIVLGGNIITRLRESPAFPFLSSLVDQIVLYQGDLAVRRTMQAVAKLGVQKARKILPHIIADEQIHHDSWAVPSFDGINLDSYVGTPAIPYVSTRGCYWGKCNFCAIPAGWSKSGYAGSAPADFIVRQLEKMCSETGIFRVKFVDEAIAPSKARELSILLKQSAVRVEWEGYARLEAAWEDYGLLERAYAGGLRKLYFGLEQAPSASRDLFGKNDRGNPTRIIRACENAGIKVHLFCMVGHPGTSREDANTTVRYLLDNQAYVDTADMVGFRLDRGAVVPGIRPLPASSEWAMSLPYEPITSGDFTPEMVNELEAECQDILWNEVPRLLHPLYRVAGPWQNLR